MPKEDGWINCDLHPGPSVDHAFDAQGPWPFEAGSIDEVHSSHTLEHLTEHMTFFREAYRVLRLGGKLSIRVPHGWHSAAWWDFTYVRPWLQEAFATLQPGFTTFTKNLQHGQEALGFAFWVNQVVMVFNRPWARMWRFRPLRPICGWAGKHLLNVYREVMMEATKTTPDDPLSIGNGGTMNPCIVPCAYGTWEHEYYGQSADNLPFHRLLIFANYQQHVDGDGAGNA